MGALLKSGNFLAMLCSESRCPEGASRPHGQVASSVPVCLIEHDLAWLPRSPPMSRDRLNAPSSDLSPGAGSLVEARFIPQRYEPNYAYPLLVLFHARGSDEQQMVRSMPALSWRNYVGLSVRGPEAVIKRGHPEGYGWGPAFARPDRLAPRP